MPRFKEDDKVYDITADEIGIVKTVYPEVNIAIVDFTGSVRKVPLDDLTPFRETLTEEDHKRKTLLDKIRGRYK